MTNTSDTGKALRPSYELDEHGAAALARLAGRYADDLPAIQRREVVRVPAVIHAVIHHQARRLLPNFLLIPPAEPPEDRAEDVADALSLLRAAREDLDGLEAALLCAARQPGIRQRQRKRRNPLTSRPEPAGPQAAEAPPHVAGQDKPGSGNPQRPLPRRDANRWISAG